jgi:hypothetical protein
MGNKKNIFLRQFLGAESLLRSYQSSSYSRIPTHFVQTQLSLLYSHEPEISSYPEPDQSSPHSQDFTFFILGAKALQRRLGTVSLGPSFATSEYSKKPYYFYLPVGRTGNTLGPCWSLSSSCGLQSVDQFVWVSGLLLGPLTKFYLTLLFSADNYLIILPKPSSLTRRRVCSLQCNHSLVPITILYHVLLLPLF